MKKILFTARNLTSSSTVALLLRLILGLVFFMHGSQKVLGWFGGGGLDGTVDFMTSISIHPVLAHISSFLEFLGGIGLIIGFLTRVWSVGLVINMLVAIIVVHSGFFVSQGGIEFALTLMIIALVLIFKGSGKYSVDYAIKKNLAGS